jgi:3-phosphoglycerate kinase
LRLLTIVLVKLQESKARELKDGDVFARESLAYHPKKRQNDVVFPQQLASLCDLYVNDASALRIARMHQLSV